MKKKIMGMSKIPYNKVNAKNRKVKQEMFKLWLKLWENINKKNYSSPHKLNCQQQLWIEIN
jgi:hypothetical protein